MRKKLNLLLVSIENHEDSACPECSVIIILVQWRAALHARRAHRTVFHRRRHATAECSTEHCSEKLTTGSYLLLKLHSTQYD